MSINQIGPDFSRTNTDNGYEMQHTVAGGVAGNKTGLKVIVNVAADKTIPTSTVCSAIMAASDTLAGTHTGKASPFHVPTPTAGVWDSFAIIDGFSTGCADQVTVTLDSLTIGSVKGLLKVRISGTDMLIPCLSTITHP